MSKTLTTVLYLTLSLCLNFSNICDSTGQVQLLDTISPRDLCVSGVLIGSAKNDLLNEFGKPDSVISHTDEFEGTVFQEYIYLRSSFYMVNNNFRAFDLRDSVFQLDYGEIAVGDPVEVIEKKFPKSYNEREVGKSETTIRVRIGKSDSYVLFTCCNERITRIMSWDDL